MIGEAHVNCTIHCHPGHGNESAHACGLERRLVNRREHRSRRHNLRHDHLWMRVGLSRHVAAAVRSRRSVATVAR